MNLLEMVEVAGIVGCGGAGFPTHIKWNAKAEHFIVNAVECEPLLGTDRFLMRHRADDIISACVCVSEVLEAAQTTIAIKGEYKEEIQSLKEAIDKVDANINIHELYAFYPAGDEQVIVYEVTGKVVPCGGIPLDVGVVVSNVATLVAVSEILSGEPLISKYITVAGEVKNPTVVKAPIGTLIEECIQAAGGALIDNPIIIVGGPMMGKDISLVSSDKQRVTKTTSGILVLPREGTIKKYKETMDLPALKKRAATSCIQCQYCTMLCPRHMLGHPLQPHMIMRSLGHINNIEDLFENNEYVVNAHLCSLCGVCSVYACPMGLQPSKVNAFLKDELGKRGIRRTTKETTVPYEEREGRRIPTHRITARVGAAKYEGKIGDDLSEVVPDEVAIALRQGPGKLPEPMIQVGDIVAKGQPIASIPKGGMGSNLHASIDGQVVEISDVIRIKK